MGKLGTCDIKISWVDTFKGKMFSMAPSKDDNEKKVEKHCLDQNFPNQEALNQLQV